ncbi:MAG: sigma-70 family RNA polymerase sigma factor [Oscillospiraceae bacterium]|nr:sigma-70 family RNA polymerase sigma factor [Oscillospiraceae bacterium]
MEDAAIVELYWQRDQQAIAETDKKYGAYCQHIAYAVCSDRLDAEECVNDTWLRAWGAMPDKRPTVLATFLGKITRNLAINRFQRKTRKKRGGGETELALEELEDCIPAALDVERRYELQEFRQAIGRFVSGLSETEQKVFVARYWYLCPVEEIARRLQISSSKTKSMLFRLRNRLRLYLKEEDLW